MCLIIADGVEVHTPFKLLWTPACLGGNGAFCYFHVASTDREMQRLSLPLGCDERPCCPLGLLLLTPPYWREGSALLQPASLEIQASLSDFDDDSGVRAIAFFPVVLGWNIVWLVSKNFLLYKGVPFLIL